MVLNMDTELQRLICVSVEKMTREPGGSGSRKGRGLDLRKALLVAHVLQDMRTAYISDDYKVIANTVCPEISSENEMERLKRTILRKEYEECVTEDVINPKRRKFLSDDWTSGAIERPPRSESSDAAFTVSPYRCPSGTQSCLLTCSEATMSKISQITHPIPVSINTSYILSHQTSEKDGNDEVCMDMEEDTPSVSEQVEVTSSNDVETATETVVESEIIQCEDVLNDGAERPEIIMDNVTTVKPLSDVTNTQGKSPSISCPLPRKKRPLPKEFLDQKESSTERKSKRTKLETSVVTSTVTLPTSVCDVAVTSSSCYLLNTTTATTLTQSTALSSSHISPSSQSGVSQSFPCSTVTSSVCTTSLVSTCTSSTNSKPKVVVEKMHKQSTLWSWSLPATCTQPRLARCLMDGVYRAQLADISNLRESSIHTGFKGLVAV